MRDLSARHVTIPVDPALSDVVISAGNVGSLYTPKPVGVAVLGVPGLIDGKLTSTEAASAYHIISSN